MANCTTCRIGGQRLTDDEWRALRHAHVSAGIRYVSCPGCGGQRWPWELPAPEVIATGMRWEYEPEEPWWELTNGVDDDGFPIPIGWIEQHHFSCRATRKNPENPRLPDIEVHIGSLADCARALRDAVLGGGSA